MISCRFAGCYHRITSTRRLPGRMLTLRIKLTDSSVRCSYIRNERAFHICAEKNRSARQSGARRHQSRREHPQSPCRCSSQSLSTVPSRIHPEDRRQDIPADKAEVEHNSFIRFPRNAQEASRVAAHALRFSSCASKSQPSIVGLQLNANRIITQQVHNLAALRNHLILCRIEIAATENNVAE